MKEEIIRRACVQYGTPLYIYDMDMFCENISTLRGQLLPDSGLFFSVKANPLPQFCKLAYQKGCGVEVASDGELNLALKAGILPKDIVFTGPGKTEEELKLAIQTGIYMINVESIQEIRKIQEIAKGEDKKVSIALRINPCKRKTTGKVQMSGTSSQFGIEEEDLTDELMVEILTMSNVDLCGIHIYMGTSILKAKEICENTEYAIQLGVKLAEKYRFHLKYLNAGGGFGVPYFSGDGRLDMEELAQGMKQLWGTYGKKLADTRVYFESGRYLLAECGLFLTRVLYRKESKDNTYLVCDGGANFHASSAFLGRFVRGNFPMHVLGREGAEKEFNVTGSSCTPTDLIGQRVKLPEETTEGDIIVIEKSGAYGLTYSPYGFLSHKLPKEVGH